MEGCYFVFVCWERSEGVCSCWGNEPVEKQMKNIRELTDDGDQGLPQDQGETDRGKGTLLRLVLKERKGMGANGRLFTFGEGWWRRTAVLVQGRESIRGCPSKGV